MLRTWASTVFTLRHDDLPALAAQAPADATFVVFHTSVMFYVPAPRRQAFTMVVRGLPGHWIANESPDVLPYDVLPKPPGEALHDVLALDGTPARLDPAARASDHLVRVVLNLYGGIGRCAAQRLSAPGGARDGGDAVLRGETGDQTDQESRSADPRAAPSVTAMDITIHASFLPHDDPDAPWPSVATPSASRSAPIVES
jgi:hypothetical protein